MTYRDIITIEPGKRGGKPCIAVATLLRTFLAVCFACCRRCLCPNLCGDGYIRRMRITVYDVLGWLAAGMSHAEILDDFPELTEGDIRACLEFVAD